MQSSKKLILVWCPFINSWSLPVSLSTLGVSQLRCEGHIVRDNIANHFTAPTLGEVNLAMFHTLEWRRPYELDFRS